MMDALRHYREVWLVDFEFRSPNGERPEPVCMVAREWRAGRTIRVWADQLAEIRQPPFPIGDDSLFVAYYASAELGCFRALGWPMPARVLDLFCEFRNRTNGQWHRGRQWAIGRAGLLRLGRNRRGREGRYAGVGATARPAQ